MWGVTGCQLDFVLLISTLWDWSLASFPMQLSDAQQNDLAICVLQTIVSRAIWSQAKLLCSPLVCQANLLRKLSEFSGTVKCADHAVTFLSLYFPSTNYFRGARAFLVPSHIMRLFHFLKLNGKKKKKEIIEQRWKSLREAAELPLCVAFFLPRSQVLREESKYSSLPQCLVFHLWGWLCLLGKLGRQHGSVSEEGVLPSHPCCRCTPCLLGSALPLWSLGSSCWQTPDAELAGNRNCL